MPAGIVPLFPGDATAPGVTAKPGLHTLGAKAQQFNLFGDSPERLELGKKPRDSELQKLRSQLRESQAEVSAQKLLKGVTASREISTPRTPHENAMMALTEKQTELMASAMKAKPQRLTSTNRVDPKATSPKLGNDGPGGRDVQEF